MSETARSANTVKIRLGVFWKVKVDDNVDSLNIDTTGKKIGANEVAANAVTEIVENAVAVALKHLGVRVKARVAKLGDFLCE